MTQNQLLTLLRAQLGDDEILLAALRCAHCGGQRVPFERAVALAGQAGTIDQWYELVDQLEDQLDSSPRALPSAAEVSVSCQALELRARERRFRRS